jgi:hypothetical protein
LTANYTIETHAKISSSPPFLSCKKIEREKEGARHDVAMSLI